MIYRTNGGSIKAPSGRELSPKATEGARATSSVALAIWRVRPLVPRAPSTTFGGPPPSRREAYNVRR